MYSMVLHNISGLACAVNAPPQMTITLQSGVQEQVAVGNISTYVGVDVGPGQILHIMIGSPGYCANPSNALPASSLTVNLPGGSLTDKRVNLDVRCGVPTVLIFTPVDPPAITARNAGSAAPQ